MRCAKLSPRLAFKTASAPSSSAWLNRLVPENDPVYTHDAEGHDDMPAHIKAALTAVSISIPVMDGKLTLGTWQGIYLWEHRRGRHQRKVVIHVGP
jgi:secondary thiamine-phosphate synthase enzyme